MKLLIDLQAAQGLNARRGIGRYSLALSEALIRGAGHDEVHLLLNSDLVERAVQIRNRFSSLIGDSRIHSFEGGSELAYRTGRHWRRQATEVVRNAAIAEVGADVVLVASMFEGFADGVVTGEPSCAPAPVATVLFDLIPLLFPDLYLDDPVMRAWYREQLRRLGNSQLLLAISECSANDGRRHLDLPDEAIVNISGAIDDPAHSFVEAAGSTSTPGVDRPFLLYVGGIDPRKNVERLIEAYALVPGSVRRQHQLVVVCSIEAMDRARLRALSSRVGLADDEVVITGYVPDLHLIALYRQAKASVFPSLYEGLGLPVLEAMASGCPVIASNTGSVAEIIVDPTALFDPYDRTGIARSIERVLCDDEWRASLVDAGLGRAADFTWSGTAQAAWRALRGLAAAERPQAFGQVGPLPDGRRRLALVSPFPPTPSGVSDYSAELAPALRSFYDVVMVDPTWERAGDEMVKGAKWFEANASSFDRIVYQFGNSEFHWPMFDLLRRYPGVVVLHDFFLSGVISHADHTGRAPGVWPQELLYSHGFPAVEFLSQTLTESDAVWRYPANRHVVNLADGVIVHSDYSKRLAKFWYGSGSSNDWSIVPLLREPIDATAEHKRQARAELGFADGDFVVAAFGMIGPTKLNDRLLDSFLYSSLGRDERCRLVFVGELAGGAYGDRLRQRLDTLGDERRYSCTGRVDARLYRQYLLGADVAVQLRTTSRGETSAAVHDCMNARTPVVVNAHGAVVDLPSDTVLMIPDTFTDDELGGALKRLREDEKFRSAMVAAARQLVSLHHRPDACAAKYAAAIERSVQHRRGRIGVSQRLRQLSGSPQAGDVAAVARSLAGSLKPPVGVRQLLVDVSELTLRDAGSGIQRVTRELLARLLRVPHEGWHVEPVYASAAHSYRYARRHLSRLLPNEVDLGPDLPIDVQDGDVFLGLDLAPHTVVQHAAELRRFRARGAKLHFVVYDLLPVTLPEAFFPGAATDHERWLSTVASLGDLVCISRSVAGEVERWLEAQPGDSPPPKVGWFPLGADFSPAGRVAGIPSSGPALLRQLDARPSFLIVGTLEPRKCHAQVLAAFDLLWGDGVDVNLVIVGKQGWMVEDLIDRIRTHPEFEARLLWVPDASDEFLDMIMMFSEALIAASRGEGFGLPVVEALRRSVPVIARDIPVFREVGGDTTTYFDGLDPAAIAKAVEQFLNPGDQSRRSAPVTTTWDESAEAILRLIGVR